MGEVKIVSNVDYSKNAVGKYTAKDHIFRKKINATQLERNRAYLNLTGKLNGYNHLSLSGNIINARSYFTFGSQGADQRIFSVADYDTQRAFMIEHRKGGTYVNIGITILNGNVSVSYLMPTTIRISEIIDYECELTIDYFNNKISQLIVNGEIVPLTTRNASTHTYFENGQNRTICFGNLACAIDSTAVSYASYPYFAQVTDSNNNIIFHFDFLGDNEAEILTDKAQYIQLEKTSAVLIQSRPIDIE